jgi:hypothetical protein
MSPEILRVVLAIVLVAHGIGHVLFLGPAVRIVGWADQSGGSWLLSPTVGDAAAHAAGALVWAAATVLFVAAAAGLALAQEWWRPVALVGAFVSLAGIVVFWDGILTASAVPALIVDVAVIVGLLVAHWPSVDAVGA